LRLKTTDTYPFMYTHNLVNSVIFIDEQKLEKLKKQLK